MGFRRRHGISRRSAIRGNFQLWNSLGKAGTPSGLLSFGNSHKNWMPFISRMDRKYSHRIMKKQMEL